MTPDEPKQSDQRPEPDNFQQAWHAASSQTRITIDAALLRNVVQRSQRDFRATILNRDTLEIGVGLLLLPYWIYQGIVSSLPWTWWLGVPAIIWVIGFFLVDRRLHPQTPSEPGEPLVNCVKNSLSQVEHQIWLLRNILWWYLLPFAIAILAFFAQVSWQTGMKTGDWLAALGFAAFLFVFVFALYYRINYINQRAVRKQLEPRRQELLALLASLSDDTTSEVSGEYPILMSETPVQFQCSPSPRRLIFRLIFAAVCFVAILWIGVPGLLFLASRLDQSFSSAPDQDYPKLSPFAAVRWQDSQPEVQLDDEWFQLVSINDHPATEIVAFSQKIYGKRWRKRFEEDLVELLSRMGHPPQDKVKLVVQSLSSSEARTLDDVPMTYANRRAIRNAAQARERDEQPPAPQSSRDDSNLSLQELVAVLRKEKNLVGLAAMVAVDGQVIASAVDGERKIGSGVPLEIGDRWHLGSITKSITATMIARLVESGQIEWSTTVGECFPDATVHDDWKPVTLKQLLTHTSGAPANFSLRVRQKKPALGPECTQARREAVFEVIAKRPEHPPGEKHAYSNVGYTIAGAMAEKAAGATWEDLVTREVLEPLKLTGAGFGPPKSPDKTLDQPRGHGEGLFGKAAMGDDAGNTLIMAPSGAVHMTLSDLCAYATEHLRGELGDGTLLSSETYKQLHTPALNGYGHACGWVRIRPTPRIPYTVYWHNGSNTMWYALVVFVPETNMVVAVTSNDCDIDQAEAAAWEIVWANVLN